MQSDQSVQMVPCGDQSLLTTMLLIGSHLPETSHDSQQGWSDPMDEYDPTMGLPPLQRSTADESRLVGKQEVVSPESGEVERVCPWPQAVDLSSQKNESPDTDPGEAQPYRKGVLAPIHGESRFQGSTFQCQGSSSSFLFLSYSESPVLAPGTGCAFTILRH